MANKIKKKATAQKVVKKQRPVIQSSADRNKSSVPQMPLPKGEFVAAVGRRKTAVARVRLYKEAGDFIVNNKVVGEYFGTILSALTMYNQPFQLTDTIGKFAVAVKVSGSGTAAQLDAVVHGVSRALLKINPDFRTLLKKEGLLTRDDRMRETRKIGTGGKARRAKQSPKR